MVLPELTSGRCTRPTGRDSQTDHCFYGYSCVRAAVEMGPPFSFMRGLRGWSREWYFPVLHVNSRCSRGDPELFGA